MNLTIIAALSENHVIGDHNTLPWHIPEDLQRFKQLTLEHAVIMGRKTYESILERLKKPLPKRKNIVLTNNLHFHDEKILIARSLEQALTYGDKEKENFIIGGEEIFKLFLPISQKMELTVVKGNYQGDAFFPDVNWSEWQLTSEDKREAYSFQTYQKIIH